MSGRSPQIGLASMSDGGDLKARAALDDACRRQRIATGGRRRFSYQAATDMQKSIYFAGGRPGVLVLDTRLGVVSPRAISAARFLRAAHAPSSRCRNERDPRYHVRRPFFLRSFFRAHAGIVGEHTALHGQRDFAPAKDRAFRQQPVDREVVR